MSTPRFYSWDDDGSPGRALTGNLQNRLKQILIPCLVTGYGDKPGAGWTIGHEHENGFSLINADGNVINFVSNLAASAPYPAMNANAIHIYAAESLTDTSKAIIDGANLCSGAYRKGFPEPAGYPRHMLGYASNFFTSQLASLQWTLVADDKTFSLNCSNSSSSAASGTIGNAFTFHAGKALLDNEVSGNFLALGSGIENYNTYPYLYALSVGYSSPINLSSGLAQTVAIGAEPYLSGKDISPSAQVAQPPARINFQQPRLSYGGNFVGRLRGVVYDDVLRSLYGWEVHLKALGFSGTDFTDRGKLALIGGYNYAFARSHSGNSILTDNPAFW